MIFKNKQIIRQNRKPILYDLYLQTSEERRPLVIFMHGFKGYKDWGNWNDFAQWLYEKGLHFLKFNFSHNGGTINDPIDFPDLESFAENSYTKELDDLGDVINFAERYFHAEHKLEFSEIVLIGHSRGGSIATLKTTEDERVNKLICLASVSNLESRFGAFDLEKWKSEGRIFVSNSRTKQEMPLNFSFYQDFKKNRERLNIPQLSLKIRVPSLVIHAKDDSVVSVHEANNLNKWIKDSELFLLEDGGHTLGMKHPAKQGAMPIQLKKCMERILAFIQ